MSFITLPGNPDDVAEPQVAPEAEYPLVIAHAEFYTNDKGNNLIKCTIGFEGHPEYQNMGYWVQIPNEDDDADRVNKKLLGIKRFFALFNIPHEGNSFNVEDFFGCTATAKVGQTEPDDNGNVYNELYVPRVKE